MYLGFPSITTPTVREIKKGFLDPKYWDVLRLKKTALLDRPSDAF